MATEMCYTTYCISPNQRLLTLSSLASELLSLSQSVRTKAKCILYTSVGVFLKIKNA